MQISCERCATSYVLDDTLIPAQGAPVQCTRCGLIFVAKPGAAAAAPAPAAAPSANATVAFGARPAPVATSTQVFGAVKDPQSAITLPGLGGAKANQTMMFGGGTGGAAKPGSSTQVFGAVSAPASPAAKPAQAANSTMIFGGAGSEPAGTPSASSTQMFGAVGSVPAQPAAASPNSTMMFGAVGGGLPAQAAKPAGSSTQMFGAVGSGLPAQAAKPAGSSTQMFGAVGSGLPAQAAKPAGSSTQMFGAVGGGLPAQPGAPSASSTMMFGAVGSGLPAQAPKPAGSSTQVFGAVGPGQPTPSSPSSTMVFGALGGQPAKPAGSSTQMFGALGGGLPVQPAKPAASSTQVFGAVGTSPGATPDAPAPVRSSTMMFGSAPGAAASAPSPGLPVREPITLPPGAITSPPEASSPAASPSPRSTVMFGAPAGASAPAWQAPPPTQPGFSPQAAEAAAVAPVTLGQPSRSVTSPASGVPRFPGAGEVTGLADDELGRELEGRSQRVGLMALAVVLLAAASTGGYWFVNRPKAAPAELVARTNDLFHGIEVDNVASLESARQGLAQVATASPPTYVTAKADELVAMSFQGADLRAQAYGLQAEFTQLEKDHAKADADHNRADWRTVVNSLVDRMKDVKARLDPLQAGAVKLDTQQNEIFKQLSTARSQLDPIPPELDRAIGVYYAFKGSDSAARFATSYRAHVPGDGWADLMAAATVDQPHQTPEALKAGLASAQAALKANPRLTRAKRVAADLELALHDFTAARATATELSLQAPDDPRVKQLLAQIDAAEHGPKAP